MTENTETAIPQPAEAAATATGNTLPPTERMWRVVRKLPGYTVPEVMQLAGTARQETITFCTALVRAGIAQREGVTRTAVRGRMPHYRLVKDPGPELPQEVRR